MAAALTRSVSCGMPARCLRALIRADAVAPSSGPVLPVTTVPSAQLNGGSRCAAGGLAAGVSLLFHFALAHGQPGLIHQQFQLVALALLDGAGDLLLAQALEVAAHDLLAGGFAADCIVHDAVACHVHAHVRGGLIGALPAISSNMAFTTGKISISRL